MLSLHQSNDTNVINVCDLSNGQIAEIVAWSRDNYIGRIVQRHQNDLITLGEDYSRSWPGLFARTFEDRDLCKVRILPKGTLLVVN